MKKNRIFCLLLIFIFSISLFSDFRVLSYNVLNFSGHYSSDSRTRKPHIIEVVNEIEPDIITMQEIIDDEACDTLLFALRTIFPDYQRAEFHDGPDTDNILFYRSSVASLLDQNVISTSLRDINEYELLIDGNTFMVYSCHLKASQGYSNEQQRLAEATLLRNRLNTLSTEVEFIVTGDMNFYSGYEPAYHKFVDEEGSSRGRLLDPLDDYGGDWHDNEYYSDIHTQAPGVSPPSGFSSGGIDDRFDFILLKHSLNDDLAIEYVDGSTTSFGNDGDHLNRSVNDGYNAVVSADIADALYYGSDHLPVYADFISIPASVCEENKPENYSIEVYPNPFNSTISFNASSLKKIEIYNLKGNLIQILLAEQNSNALSWSPDINTPSGVYLAHVYYTNDKSIERLIYLK